MEVWFAASLGSGWSIAIVLGLLAVAIFLFASDYVSVDIVTLLLLLALIGAGILSPAEAFAGFSQEIIVVIACIFVLSGALQETGVVDAAGSALLKVAGTSETRVLVVLMLLAAGLSAFINNTTVVALLVGPAVGLARKARISPSRVLLPLAFASILGGTCTLIGTSTNMAVSGYVARAGLEPIGLFEITPIGLLFVGVGVVYLLLVGRHFLPNRLEPSLAEGDAVREYASEIVVMRNSPLIGQPMFHSELSEMGFRILKARRGNRTFNPDTQSQFQEGDVVVVVGNVEDLIKVKTAEGIEIQADWKLGDLKLPDEDVHIVETVVTPQSTLVGRTLRETRFHQQTGLTVLGIYRRGKLLGRQIATIRLMVGDLLLVQGEKERLTALQRQRELAVLSALPIAASRRNRGWYAVGWFAGALILNLLGMVPLAVGLLGAAVGTVLTRCISADRAYQYIEWRLLILIGGMTGFGLAVDKTGADELLAGWIVGGLQPFGVTAVLAGFFVLTILLTQPMSNAAAALVVLPVALEAARVLGVNERSFAIAIMLAASVSFITPFEPSSVLVYGPGRYRFADFLRTGGLLTLILAVLAVLAVQVLWPFVPSRP